MKRIWLYQVVAILLTSMAGCGIFDPVEPEPAPRFNGDAYQVGNLDGPLADDLDRHLQLVEHDGIKANGPLIIGADVRDELTPDEVAAIRAAFGAGYPVAVVDADASEVAALRELLGVTSFTFEFPADLTHVEIYALDHEPDGSTFERVQIPPIDQANTAASILQHLEDDTEVMDWLPESVEALADGDDQQSIRTEAFARWLEDDQIRMQKPMGLAAKSYAQQQAASQNLPDIAKAWVMDVNYTFLDAHYQISHFIYSCHEINSGFDWFLVQQWCVFSGKGAVTDTGNRHKGKYMDEIELDAWVTGYENQPAMVRMIKSGPETANDQTTVTSGVSWTLGGEVALDGPKVIGGLTIESSQTFTISDCTVYNQSNDRQNNAHWLYKFRRCDVTGFWQDHLTNPPNLAVTTFQPINQWIWKMAPQVRAADPTMSVHFRPQLVDTDMSYYFFAYNIKHTWWWWDIHFTVRFPFPPINPPQE